MLDSVADDIITAVFIHSAGKASRVVTVKEKVAIVVQPIATQRATAGAFEYVRIDKFVEIVAIQASAKIVSKSVAIYIPWITDAYTVGTHVVFSAVAAVITNLGVIGVITDTACWVAMIIGAEFSVTTELGPARLAAPIRTCVSLGARISVVTRRCVRCKHTTAARIAAVIGAQVVIITFQGC